MESTVRWFRQSLGTRIDALAVAIKSLEQEEPEAASTIRQFAQSLVAPTSRLGFTHLAKAASAIVAKPDALVADAAQNLIRLLREEAAKAKRSSACVLVIGGDEPLNSTLVERLTTADREVVVVSTAADAQAILRDRVVVFIVLSLFLPDMDGRAMISRLRGNPMTASMPLLVLAQKLPANLGSDSPLSSEAMIQLPAKAEDVVSHIATRLRRSREGMKEAHRDPPTGLLNRAAFREHTSRVLEACTAAKEPLTLAIVVIDGATAIQEEYGPAMIDEITQRIGSILSSSLRATDTVARWGTQEFAAIFPGEDPFGGTRAVDKVREKVQNESFATASGSVVQVTLSAGLSLSSDGATADSLTAEADRYLYQAQAAGGNRVVSSQSRVPHRAERVLALLSDKVAARVLSHLFTREGFEVTHMSDASQGIAAAAGRHRFHLIIVDEQLPDRGGFDVLQELRQMPRNNRVPIVMLISRNSPQSIVRSLELGASDYVIMPLSPLTFMTHMRRLMKRTAPGGQRASPFRRLLVVDDDVRTLLLAASSLHERGGFHVVLAKGAADAVKRIEQERPDVVIIPATLASPDGQDAVAQVLDAVQEARGSAILASGNLHDPLAASANKNFAGVVHRPLNPMTFAGEVETVIGVAHNTMRPPRAIEQLNAEIQRITRMK